MARRVPIGQSIGHIPRMNEIDPRRADLNLLTVFATLMRERSVTRAGQKLFLSQSATSAALSRLRDLFRDELFVRVGRSIEPTARALDLWERLDPAMQAITAALVGSIPFDPATDAREFRIGMPDNVAVALLPRLMVRMRAEAPHCILNVRHADYLEAPRMLSNGDISAAIGYLTDDLPATARVRTLRRVGWRVLRGDPAPGPLTLEDYVARPHVLVTPAGDLSGIADRVLAEHGLKRRVVLGLPDFTILPTLLAGTDLIATVSDFVGDAFAAQGGLRAEEPPVPFPVGEMRLAWRAAVDSDPGERWLRGLITAILGHA